MLNINETLFYFSQLYFYYSSIVFGSSLNSVQLFLSFLKLISHHYGTAVILVYLIHFYLATIKVVLKLYLHMILIAISASEVFGTGLVSFLEMIEDFLQILSTV